VAFGSTTSAIGLRTPLQNAYSAAVPAFGFVADPAGRLQPHGGQFWDGRADTLAAQALQPLLNPAEMNNASAAAVVAKVAAAPYAAAFEAQFGPASLSNASTAFSQIGLAIQAFEQATPFQAFSSKYDAVLAGKASFSAAEQRGLALFTNPASANCASCHAMNPKSSNPADSLFTNFSYHADGVPRNPALPQNQVASFYDLGLCGPERSTPSVPAGVNAASLCGKFRVPSLRNVALRQHYMHNAFFTSLSDVVSFYATRASDPQRWYGPSGVPNDLPAAYLKNLETAQPPFNGSPSTGAVLNAAQISDLVAFLGTLSDGFVPSPAP
jgi:cytochrome c peroxidase